MHSRLDASTFDPDCTEAQPAAAQAAPSPRAAAAAPRSGAERSHSHSQAGSEQVGADARARLERALEKLAEAEPPQLFAGRYVLLQERVAGGQAIVNFARGRGAGLTQYAIKCVIQMRLHPIKAVASCVPFSCCA